MTEIEAEVRRAKIYNAMAVCAALSTVTEPHYLIALCGSVLKYGEGRDIDILLVRQQDEAIHPYEMMDRMIQAGFDERIRETRSDGTIGGIFIFSGHAVDVTFLGHANRSEK